MFLSTINTYAALKQEGDFQYAIEGYEYKDGTHKLGACIYHYTATYSDATFTFPDEIEGYTVVELASGTVKNTEFFISSEVRDSIKEAVIPSSVEIIDYTFEQCKSLEAVYFEGNNLRKIGPFSFAYCKSLSSINLPSSVEEIGQKAFNECDSLEEFIIPESIKRLGKQPGDTIGFVFSGNNLKNIYNSSQLDFSISIISRKIKSWYYDEEGTQKAEIIPAGGTIYRIQTPHSVLEYLEIIEPKLEELEKSGLSMSVANDADTFRKYVNNYVGEYNGDDFKRKVSTTPYALDKPRSFIPAKAGSKSEPLGKDGLGSISLKITATDDEHEVYYQKLFSVKIKSIPYSGGTNFTESSESECFEPSIPAPKMWDVMRGTEGLHLNNLPVYDGE